MLAFDRQMKLLGFAGNQAQIVLGIKDRFSEADLAERIRTLKKRFPILEAKPVRGIVNRSPYWKIPSGTGPFLPCVRTHHAHDRAQLHSIKVGILNRPLDTRRGELFRLDLIHKEDAGMEVIMTWSHMLMDVRGAEYLLAMIGGSVSVPEDCTQEGLLSGCYTERMPGGSKFKQAEKSFGRIDELALNPPVSIYTRTRRALASRLDYRVISFTSSQTDNILELAEKHGGFLNESAYYAAATLGEFSRLMASKNIFSPGFVVPVSIDLRKKGTRMPVFSNQSANLLYGFDPEELEEFDSILASFTRQAQDAVRNDIISSSVSAMEYCRFIPSGLYAKKIRQAFKGEIASLVFANPGKTFAPLQSFMGCRVEYQHHVPSVVVPPGIGIVFYIFSRRLHITLVYVESMLTAAEADDFLRAVGRDLASGKLT
ncbi:MAG: hypothetical protein KGY38_05895 [Desulfobacterales bacterium]|nr:hypothetical protein [Desulfobacterales bacterium]